MKLIWKRVDAYTKDGILTGTIMKKGEEPGSFLFICNEGLFAGKEYVIRESDIREVLS